MKEEKGEAKTNPQRSHNPVKDCCTNFEKLGIKMGGIGVTGGPLLKNESKFRWEYKTKGGTGKGRHREPLINPRDGQPSAKTGVKKKQKHKKGGVVGLFSDKNDHVVR